ALVNLGAVYQEAGELSPALNTLRAAVELDPGNPQAWNNIGRALHSAGRLAEAVAAFDRAIAVQPEMADAHFNRSLSLLLAGDWEHGWQEYAWRWRSSGFPTPWRDFAQPVWNREPLDGRTILVHAEQGLGDTIQFVRYLALLAAQGARVILECPPELARLLAGVPKVEAVIPHGEPLPPFDFHAPLMSLPAFFGTRPESIPANVPYLAAPPELAGAWREQLRHLPRPVFGLAWAGNPRNTIDRARSMSASGLAPLARLSGVNWISLQKGPAASQLGALGEGMPALNLAPSLQDFADTAAAITHLDGVVCVDTAVAHLTGALGKPLFLLLPAVPDWRWLLSGETTPWYPSARLFRQETQGDWSGPLARLIAQLSSTQPI
ncbi:MAG: tetratricopeptide repeat protein, partial [Chloroflexi bacterium]|nr:tetratricopeptide repeat protein [Chloroflexota bacterium]